MSTLRSSVLIRTTNGHEETRICIPWLFVSFSVGSWFFEFDELVVFVLRVHCEFRSKRHSNCDSHESARALAGELRAGSNY